MSLVLAAGGGQAHSKKQTIPPSEEVVLNASPDVIAMTFDMPLRVTLITRSADDGTEHALARADNMQPVSAFDATPPMLASGGYTVEWRGLARHGRPMQGGFSFEIE